MDCKVALHQDKTVLEHIMPLSRAVAFHVYFCRIASAVVMIGAE